MMTLYDFIGFIGIAFTIVNYALLQWRREYAKEMRYSFGNLIGSILLGVSLTQKWNPASFTITVTMGIISLYGVYRCWSYMTKAKQIEKMLKSRL